jgi:hypothetical protein
MGSRQDFFRRLFNRRVTGFTLAGGNRRSALGFFGTSMSTRQENQLRRIALAAALAATLAGGAAALAATPGAATPDAAPPDPYQGAWTLTIDDRPVGPVTQVQGCSLAAPVLREVSGAKHLSVPAPEECTFEAGAGMTADFTKLLGDSLNGTASAHQMELVRVDPSGHYGLRLDHALVTSVGLPKIDRAGTTPVFLEVGVKGDEITRDAAPPLPAKTLPATGFDPAQLQVSLSGQPLAPSAAGPWTAELKTPAEQIGVLRESATVRSTVDIGDLPLRIPEDSKAMSRVVDPWAQSALLNGGVNAEQTVKLTVGRLVLTLDHAAPDRADLVPRADGARTYSLYAEHAGIVAG